MVLRMIYMLPMLLGRTFDVKKNTVGIDIYPVETIQNPRIIHENIYTSGYQRVETSADVNDVLGIQGELALRVKAGAFSAKGYGSYLKERVTARNTIDILTKMTYRTVSKSIPHSAQPVSHWTSTDAEFLGTHYVKSILYGGDLIATVRFIALKSEYLEEIKGAVKASLEAGNSALELVVEGKLEKLDKQLSNKARMEINYYASVPLERVPNDIKGLRELVRNFRSHVEKVNNGQGVPVEVELKELSTLNQQFMFLKNSDLESDLRFFEEMYDDLLSTKSRLNSWVRSLPNSLTEEQEAKIADLNGRLSTITAKFGEVIAALDVESGPIQLEPAQKAYREGKALGMAGRFSRELNRLQKKIVVPKTENDAAGSSTYVQYGSSECTGNDSTTTIFSGYLSSAPRTSPGSGYNYLCLPKSPEYSEVDRKSIDSSTVTTGMKYGLLKAMPFSTRTDATVLRGIVCASCLIKGRQAVIVLNGKSDCPEKGNWKLQYRGYLMSASDSQRGETVCVDTKLESHEDSYMGYDDQGLTMAVVSDSQKYTFIFVPCVVCSK